MLRVDGIVQNLAILNHMVPEHQVVPGIITRLLEEYEVQVQVLDSDLPF